jgi:cytochrome c oxidase assembly protein subunit 15
MSSRAGPRAMGAASARQIAAWLSVCCALIFLMVVVGGVTRLTHSGLSMTEWQPLVGAVPPLSEGQWNDVFEKYSHSPEYLKVNPGMTLAEFKRIFWWEYFHRLLGRTIGAAFLLPLLYFLARGRIDAPLAGRLAVIFALGALQGALGWYMVQSGLIDDPHVSPYRLTAHLGLAFLIYAAMLRSALELLAPRPPALDVRFRPLRLHAAALTVLIFVMVLSGGMVAGTRAGFVYNTFPLMDGRWIPDGVFSLRPWYANFLENIPTIQFDHRLIALLLALLIPALWFRISHLCPARSVRRCATLLLGALVLQLSLGIATLLHGVPVALAASHQGGALLLFTAALLLHHELGRVPAEPAVSGNRSIAEIAEAV